MGTNKKQFLTTKNEKSQHKIDLQQNSVWSEQNIYTSPTKFYMSTARTAGNIQKVWSGRMQFARLYSLNSKDLHVVHCTVSLVPHVAGPYLLRSNLCKFV